MKRRLGQTFGGNSDGLGDVDLAFRGFVCVFVGVNVCLHGADDVLWRIQE